MKKYCVIGKSLPHTLSPQIHSEFGLDYSAVELHDENELKAFIENLQFDGFNITIPYKQTVMKYLDEVSETAKNIGAVNTVVRVEGKLRGYNTDLEGLSYALDTAEIVIKDKCVMVLGSGGASKTAQYLAKMEGAKSVTVVSRSGEVNYENCYDRQKTQVVINTTPVGMMPCPDASPIDLAKLPNLQSVYDLVYNPPRTRLLMQAKKLGKKSSNGLCMLVEQARLARDLFTQKKSKQSLTTQVLKKLERGLCNLVLTGMAGSGKSEIGKQIAKITGRQFFDTDSMIVKSEGMSIVEIFKRYGEKHFRELETRAVGQVSKLKSAVIATGGGAPLSEQNRNSLSANGKIVLLQRRLEKLATSGRPLSTDLQQVKSLWEERQTTYRDFADVTIDNNKNIEDAVIAIMEII